MKNKDKNIQPITSIEGNANKNILLGVTGGIAAYKSADLVRRLRDFGFNVRVVMTQSAQEFITSTTLQAVSGHPVHFDLFDCESDAGMGHIEFAKWADVVLIAPATANCIAKIAHGIADDLLTTIVLAAKAPLIIAPAMNQQMWINQAVKDNLVLLKSRAVEVIEPASGEQACGDIGQGRMQEPLQIAQQISQMGLQKNTSSLIETNSSTGNKNLTGKKSLAGRKIVITAGPTQEAIDPVRYISNHSSGKMGFALADAAAELGADVVLISGPVGLSLENKAKLIKIKSAEEMFSAVKNHLIDCDIFIGCAAVADYRPIDIASQKIKKNDEQMQLTLVRNPDILNWVSQTKSDKNNIFVVGFAAESENLKAFAMSKLTNKKLDMICANDISMPNLGFNSDNNALLVLNKQGEELKLPPMPKREIAVKVFAEIVRNMPSLSGMTVGDISPLNNGNLAKNNKMEKRSENRH